jgi:uncharacterized phiE125 gp8 family phage protein
MDLQIKLITDVITELVSITELKTQLRIDASDEDAYLPGLITAAREYCENFTGRTIGTKTLEGILDDFPCEGIYLFDSPVQSITSIKYIDSDGTENTWNSIYYVSNLDIIPERIYPAYGQSWPAYTPYPTGSVRITYQAGHTSSNLPEAIKQAILLVAGDLYENREATSEKRAYELPFSVRALLMPYKIRWFR